MKQSIPTQELPFQKGLKKFLARKGITQRDLSHRIYMSSSMVCTWIHGRGADPSITLALLALEGMTLEEMFGEEVANTLLANSKPKEEAKEAPVEAKEETRSDVQKKGFISKLAMLFGSRGDDE